MKEGSDNFEVTKQDVVGVCSKHYVFNAAPADGSHFDATAACPPLKRNDATQAEVAAKQNRDEAKIAELAGQACALAHPSMPMAASIRISLRWQAMRAAQRRWPKAPSILLSTKASQGKRGGWPPPGTIRTAANSVQGPGPKPAELKTAATAAPEPAKPQDSSLFARLWGGKPVEAKAETPPPQPKQRSRGRPGPSRPRRNEATAAKPRDTMASRKILSRRRLRLSRRQRRRRPEPPPKWLPSLRGPRQSLKPIVNWLARLGLLRAPRLYIYGWRG